MPNVAVKGSMGSGHDGFTPRASVTGAPLVTIAGIPIQVQGDVFPSHTDGNSSHSGSAVSKRPWFTVNGKGVCCVGDPVSCGSIIISGNALVQIS